MRQSVISAHIVDQVARELRITAPFSLQKQFLRGALDSAPRGSSKLPTHQAEERSGEPFVMEQQEPNAFHRSSDTQARESADAISDLNTNKEWGAKLPAGSGTEAGTGVTPSALSARMRWVAVAGAIALLLLALNVVNSTQLAGIYSVLSGETRTTVPDSASLPLRHSQSPDNLKADSASSARATSDRMATKREPVEVATTDAGNEIKGNDVPGGANPLPAQAIEPPASALESASPQAQPADASPSKKNETRPVVTLEVVARSKVRAKPNDQSEIIAELEPGNRVTVLAKSRDYYHVRSVEDKTIRGYVHREDAFFESKNKR